MDTEVYFRFMDLPVELRLMIYEYLTFMTRQHPIKKPDNPSTGSGSDKHSDVTDTYGTMTKKYFPVAILGVCKEINLEAKAIVLEKLQQLSRNPVRLSMDMSVFAEIMNTRGLIKTLVNALGLMPLMMDPRPRKRFRIEMFLKKSAEEKLGDRVYRGLALTWGYLGGTKTYCTVFSEETLPDYWGDVGNMDSNFGVPGTLIFNWTKAETLRKDLDNKYRDCGMEVIELSEEESAQQEKGVALDSSSMSMSQDICFQCAVLSHCATALL